VGEATHDGIAAALGRELLGHRGPGGLCSRRILLTYVAFTILHYFFAGEFSVAARVGICVLAFVFGLLLMWVTEPFFGDHMSDSTKEAWLWPLRIVIYFGVPIAVGWLARRKGVRLAGRAPTAPTAPKEGA
jgi:hypothetical protein